MYLAPASERKSILLIIIHSEITSVVCKMMMLVISTFSLLRNARLQCKVVRDFMPLDNW